MLIKCILLWKMSIQLNPKKSDAAFNAIFAWISSGVTTNFLQYGKLVNVVRCQKGWWVTTTHNVFNLIPDPALDGPLHTDHTYTLIEH